MKWLIQIAVALIATPGLAVTAGAQAKPLAGPDVQKIYDRLLPQIEKIPMYDNHAHPGFGDDSDVDAMAAVPGETDFMRTRADNPEFIIAAKQMVGYPYSDFSPEHMKWLTDKTKAAEATGDTKYFNSIIDKLNTETVLANRAMMAPYLDPKRFHWVFFVDAFFYPFDNTERTGSTPDMGVYIPLQEKMLSRYKKLEGIEGLPADLAGYEDFARRTLTDNQQKRGGVAMKFEAAYFRSLYFGDPPRATAAAIYDKYHAGGVPTAQEYNTFQDYIFRVLIDQAGKLHLPTHIHSAVGIGDYFSMNNGKVMNLENVLRDPRYKDQTFVLLHGGWPYYKEAALFAAVKNVYLDTSFQSEFLYPSQFKEVIKTLLTMFPEKMMYASDAFPFNDALGAEESFWLSARSTRTALTAALAELISEGAYTEPKALELAHMYLHDNAAKLYGGSK